MTYRLDKLLPCLPERRGALLAVFAASMRYIHDRRSDWCVVRRAGHKIRLFAGRLIVLTLQKDRAWLATDVEQRVPDDLAQWEWDLNDYPAYKRPPSRNGYFTPKNDWQREWWTVSFSHFAYLDRALRKGSGMAPDHRSVAKHDVGLAEIIASTSLEIPYESPPSPSDDQLVMRDQLDMRIRMQRLTVVRPGQRDFRQAVLSAYGSRCAVSGCDVADVLEAAHICQYNGSHTDQVRNALLLRSDLHKLFDAKLLTVSASGLKLLLSPTLMASSYAEYNGQRLSLPTGVNCQPSAELLKHHENAFYEKVRG
jgi:hypothetical protein